MRFLCAIAALLLTYAVAAQQDEQPDKPWEAWEPAEIVMPDPNAFDIYLEAFALVEELGEPDENEDLQTLGQRLEGHRLTFRLLRAALMGDCRLPPFTFADQELPYLAKFRSAARMLAMRAGVMRSHGLYLEAALDAIDGVRMAQDAASQRALIGLLVGTAIEAISLKSLGETAPFLNEVESRIAINSLRSALSERTSLLEVLEGECDLTRHIFCDLMVPAIEEGVAKKQAEELVQQDLALWKPHEAWIAMNEFYGEVLKRAKQERWERWEPIEADDPFVRSLLPAFERIMLRSARARAQMALALTRLAVHAYWVAKGNAPEDLDALVPTYLPDLPLDPFSGKALLGRSVEGGVCGL